jgi:hypothetical protein
MVSIVCVSLEFTVRTQTPPNNGVSHTLFEHVDAQL